MIKAIPWGPLAGVPKEPLGAVQGSSSGEQLSACELGTLLFAGLRDPSLSVPPLLEASAFSLW